MWQFIKKNFVWVAIFLCLIGVVLSIVGISTNPIFFFIGIIFALPSIAYLIYQVFFDHSKPALNTTTTTSKQLTGNITTIIEKKEEKQMDTKELNGYADHHEIDTELEPLYNGYADEQEIEKQLEQIIQEEHQKSLNALAAHVISEKIPVNDSAAIQQATENELLKQREIELADILAVEDTETDAPADISPTEHQAVVIQPQPMIESDDDVIATLVTPTTAPKAPDPEPVQHIEQPAATFMANDKDMQTYINPWEPLPGETPVIKTESVKIPRIVNNYRAKEKKTLLTQANLEKYFQHYFLETATCFFLDRNIYKDSRGIAPYNKLATDKNTKLPAYVMALTKGKLYKFCSYLIDMERFITHPDLYQDFVHQIEQGIPLGRISETLHALYRKKYKKEFVLTYSKREDWDNLIILVYNNYILHNDNFKDVFTRVPFAIPADYNEENVIKYLDNPDLQARFLEKFPSFTDIGISTPWQAIYICFINSIKTKLSIEQLENAILKDYKRVIKTLKRNDAIRSRRLRKVS